MKNRKGFTIVELVIVIAVIAILAAVLIPTFTTVTKNAKTSAAQSQAKNALDQIIASTGGSMPEGTAFYVTDDNDPEGDYLFVFEKQALTQKDIDATGYPVAKDGVYTVYVTYDAFNPENSEAVRADALTAAEGLMAGACKLTGGTWNVAAINGQYYPATYTVGEGEDAVVTNFNIYYTNEIQKTIVVFYAAQ